MNVKGCFSHKSDDWATPPNIYDWYVVRHGFYDPCPLFSNYDGLVFNEDRNLFINPPYSDIETWVDFALRHLESFPNRLVVMLLPVRTDRPWFRKLHDAYGDFVFIQGRLKFGGKCNYAPFPSMLVFLRYNCGIPSCHYIFAESGDISDDELQFWAYE